MSADEYQISMAGGDGDVADLRAVPFHKLSRSQLLTLSIALEEQRDRALTTVRSQQATIAAVLALANAHGRRGFLVSPADIRAALNPAP